MSTNIRGRVAAVASCALATLLLVTVPGLPGATAASAAASGPSEPGAQYVLDWEDPAHRVVPAAAPPGWAREYDPSVVHADGEPQLRVASATAGDPVRRGAHALRVQLEKDDPVINNGTRAELSAEPVEPRGAERWYGFSTYLPADFEPDQAAEILVQWHQVGAECSNGCSPPLSLLTRDGKYHISQNWEISPGRWHFHTEEIGAYETGRWTDWVVHVKWSTGADGVLEVWKDGRQVPGFAPRLGRNDDYADRTHGNYMKIGLYKWAWSQDKPSDTTRRVVYYDELRIADESGSFERVAPPDTGSGSGDCVTATPGGAWIASPLGTAARRFEARVTLTPDRAPLDAEIAFTRGSVAIGDFPRLAVTVRFNPRGVIDARAGDRWVASQVRYRNGGSYRVRVAVDLDRRRYSAWVTPPEGSEQPIGRDLPFRTQQQQVAALDTMVTLAVQGSLQACSLAVAERPRAASPVVAAAGDIACDPTTPGFEVTETCAMAATSELLLARDVDAVLALGDLQYDNGTFDKFRRSYHPTWGRARARTRPVPGNHEYSTAGAAGYFDYFGAAAGDRRKGYYSFDLGAWHVVALNSNCSAVGGCGAGSPQERWLRADLAAHPARCTLAYMHHPRYSSGSHGGSDRVRALWQALEKAKAEVVLAGHDHHYERFAPQDSRGNRRADGLRQFVVGTGGAPLRDVRRQQRHSEVRRADAHGVLELTLHPDRYSWAFRTVDDSVADSGETRCQGTDPSPAPEIDLAAHVDRFVDGITRASSQRQVPPRPEQARALTAGVRAAAAGDVAAANTALRPLSYGARSVRDSATGEQVVLVEESLPAGRADRRSWGMAVLRPGRADGHLLEVPHPRSEYRVEDVGVDAFRRGGSSALLVAGTDRRADNPSADAAHAPDGAFEVLHRALLARGGRVVQVHGFSTANHSHGSRRGHGDLVISDGTLELAPHITALAERTRARGFRVCLPATDSSCRDLAGTTNAQGRSARRAGAAFVHLEVEREVRADDSRRSALVDALVQPARPADAAGYVVVPPTVKVRPTSSSITGADEADLVGGRNEFVSFQVVVPGGRDGRRNVSVALGAPLSGPGGSIPARNVTVYREEYYTATRASSASGDAGRWPDPLVPSVDTLYGEARRAFPVQVPADENRVVFVDVLVPQQQAPGVYTGSLLLTSDGEEVVVPVRLDVRDFTLPSTSSSRSLFKLNWNTPCLALHGRCPFSRGEDAWRSNSDLARLALDHRVTIANPQFQPPVNGTERRYFEQYMLPLVDGTAATRLPGARMTTVAVDTSTAAQVAAWRSLAGSHGFSSRAVSYDTDCDEPGDHEQRWSACRDAVEMIRRQWPGLPNVVTTNIEDASEPRRLDLVDVIVPVIDHLHGKPGSPHAGDQRPAYDTFLAQPGRQMWLYTSCDASGCGGAGEDDPGLRGWVDYTIDTAASQNRAMGWMQHLYRTSGELYYATDLKLTTAWTDQWAFGGNGDGTLFYPGTPSRIGGSRPVPLPSLRLKMIRNGNQDLEYLRLAEAAGHGEQARRIARTLFPNAHSTITSGESVEAARRRLADLIAPATGRR